MLAHRGRATRCGERHARDHDIHTTTAPLRASVSPAVAICGSEEHHLAHQWRSVVRPPARKGVDGDPCIRGRAMGERGSGDHITPNRRHGRRGAPVVADGGDRPIEGAERTPARSSHPVRLLFQALGRPPRRQRWPRCVDHRPDADDRRPGAPRPPRCARRRRASRSRPDDRSNKRGAECERGAPRPRRASRARRLGRAKTLAPTPMQPPPITAAESGTLVSASAPVESGAPRTCRRRAARPAAPAASRSRATRRGKRGSAPRSSGGCARAARCGTGEAGLGRPAPRPSAVEQAPRPCGQPRGHVPTPGLEASEVDAVAPSRLQSGRRQPMSTSEGAGQLDQRLVGMQPDAGAHRPGRGIFGPAPGAAVSNSTSVTWRPSCARNAAV